jgi:hypothetical protein
MISKVITHDGIFHADDVMAVALMQEFIDHKIQVERTRNISIDDYNNPDVWIVDVGGKFDRVNNNYDHHQDNTLPAACMLVLTELVNLGRISIDMQEELFDAVYEISDIDCHGPMDKNGFQFNTLIKSFNAIEDGFKKAVWVCRNYIQSCKENVANAARSREIWDDGEVISTTRVCKSFPIHWKRYEEQMFLVYPQAGKWNLITRDSNYAPIVDSHLKAEFVHANRFIAVFNNRADAIQCGILSHVISKI